MRNNKIFNIQIIVTVVGILSLVVGVSFAIFSFVTNSTKKQVIRTGSVSLALVETESGIEMTGLQEMTDLEGLQQENSYDFTITNNGSEGAKYQIALIDDLDAISEYEGILLDDAYVKVGLRLNGVEYGPMNLEQVNRILYSSIIDVNEVVTGELRSWLDFTGLTNLQKAALGGQSIFLNLKVIANQMLNIDVSGANGPELATGMIPVYYDETNSVWRKADKYNENTTYQWYDYDAHMWANAVTVQEISTATTLTLTDGTTQNCVGTTCQRSDYINSPAGTVIPMDDINVMLVWIPRFSAVTPQNSGVGNETVIDVTFVDKNTTAHDAFTFGSQNLTGYWVGKFEVSSDVACIAADSSSLGSGCNLNTINPKVLPNVRSWYGASASTFYTTMLAMKSNAFMYGFNTTTDTTLDTHMMKNNEWGAVAYLTQSNYGRCTNGICDEIGINNNGGFVTGYGAPAGSDQYVPNGTYETTLGQNSSTTGNIYGIYDMSGGSWEAVMGIYKTHPLPITGINDYSGFSSTTNNSQYDLLTMDAKYYNNYTTSSDYSTLGLQHAIIETSGWYGDGVLFINSNHPWLYRGHAYASNNEAGINSYSWGLGDSIIGSSARLVISK